MNNESIGYDRILAREHSIGWEAIMWHSTNCIMCLSLQNNNLGISEYIACDINILKMLPQIASEGGIILAKSRVWQ